LKRCFNLPERKPKLDQVVYQIAHSASLSISARKALQKWIRASGLSIESASWLKTEIAPPRAAGAFTS
jgi:hypothetical protein